MIDAHQHFWTTSRDDYGWLTPDDAVLYRDFGPDDLAPLIAGVGISRTVVVQAAATVAETRYLLDLADRTDWVAGVVGWVPLDETGVADVIGDLSAHPKAVGVRPMIQDIADDDWMLGQSVGRGLRSLVEHGLAFDALVHPRHLAKLGLLVERHPDLRVVIDHAAKPSIRTGEFDTWASDMARIARDSNAACKLSGLVTEASPGWQTDDLQRYVDHLIECFGPSRLMWGSDWPVVELAGGFSRWRQATLELLGGIDAEARAAILGESAERFYHLDSDPMPLPGTRANPAGER